MERIANISRSAELTPHPAMYYVYVLRNIKSKEFYYGYTKDLRQRFQTHKNNNFLWELIYYEAYKSKVDAFNRERRLKKYAQALSALKIRLRESLR